MRSYHKIKTVQSTHLVGVNWGQVHSFHHLLLFLFFPDLQLPADWEIPAEIDYSLGFLKKNYLKKSKGTFIMKKLQATLPGQSSSFFWMNYFNDCLYQ